MKEHDRFTNEEYKSYKIDTLQDLREVYNLV